MNFSVSVIAPMFNEELCIRHNVEKMLDALKSLDCNWELVLVNDGSIDRTLDIVSEIAKAQPRLRLISYSQNRGRGYALRKGFSLAAGDYIITTESDLSWGVEIIKQLLDRLTDEDEGCDVVVASPYRPGGRLENIPLGRAFLSRLGNKLLTLAISSRLTMVTAMTRGYKKDAIKSLTLYSDGKEIHLEIISKAVALGYKIDEIAAVLRWERPRGHRAKRRSTLNVMKTIWTHLGYSFFERPIMLFGSIGFILLSVGFLIGLYLVYVKVFSTLVAGRPLMALVIILVVIGFQMLSFGLIAILLSQLRRDIYKLEAGILKNEKKIPPAS